MAPAETDASLSTVLNEGGPAPLPDLAPALDAAAVKDDPAKVGPLTAALTSGQNRGAWALHLAHETAQAALA